jgi:hypothetical protein
MTTHCARLISASLLVLALVPSAATAQPGSLGRIDVPPVPSNLEVPDGHVVYLHGYAVGTQNYICLPAPSGPAWTFVGPQATLFRQLGGNQYHQITTHFLSPNPAEGGIARPSWQHSSDSSQVWGRARAASTDPAFVAPGAIPWLLVEIAGARLGTVGSSVLAETTFIQRLNTSGGVAPSTACQVGAFVMVPYSTDYFFYRASPGR